MMRSSWTAMLCGLALGAGCGGRVDLDDTELGGFGGVGNRGAGGGVIAGSGGKIGAGATGGGGFSGVAGGSVGGGFPVFGGAGGMPAGGGGFVFGGAGGAFAGMGGGSVGGFGGSGGRPTPPNVCSSKKFLTGVQPRITDFESHLSPQDVFYLENVLAGMYLYIDPADTQGVLFSQLVAGRAPGNFQAFRGQFFSTTWGGGAGVWFGGCIDASIFAGIRLWARSSVPSGRVRLSLGTTDSLPRSEGGHCPDAYCIAAEVAFSASESWAEYTLPWTFFSPAFNSNGAFSQNGDNLLSINLHLDNFGLPAEMWIEVDDIGFLAFIE